MIDPTDLGAISDIDLEELRKTVAAEQDRRSRVAVAAEMLETLPPADRESVIRQALGQQAPEEHA